MPWPSAISSTEASSLMSVQLFIADLRFPAIVTTVGKTAPQVFRPCDSNRSISKCAQHGVNPRLIALALRFEPLQYILIDAQRNGCFRRSWLQATAHYAANDTAHCDLWVIFRWRGFRRLIAQARPIGFRLRFRGGRCPLRDAWLCGRR
jgi:hypothetical protein